MANPRGNIMNNCMCEQCGKNLNSVDAILGCKTCAVENHKSAIRRAKEMCSNAEITRQSFDNLPKRSR